MWAIQETSKRNCKGQYQTVPRNRQIQAVVVVARTCMSVAVESVGTGAFVAVVV
jgi:hypothetical protein